MKNSRSRLLCHAVLSAVLTAASLIAPVPAGTTLHAAEAQQRPVRIAVLDLKSPAATPWLGPAVSEAVAVKLAGVAGVTLVERDKVRALLATAEGEAITPRLLGADALLTGSVQLAGTWPDKTAKIRLSATIVAAETARIQGDASFVLEGTVGELFRLESQLAERFAKTIGKEPTVLQVDYREERNLEAKQFFGQALVLLETARDILAKPKGEAPRNGVQSPIEHLTSAIPLFRQAQQANAGAFYARAHHYEGRARELLARAQADDAAAQTIREETVEQFRQDAADAAPAFYDLGRALQANEQYEEALASYQDYLEWMDESQKVVQWQSKGYHKIRQPVRAPFLNGPDVPQTRIHTGLVFATKSRVLCPSAAKLCAYSIASGELLWETDVKERLAGGVLTARHGRVAYLGKQHLSVWDEATGEMTAHVQIPGLPELIELSKSIVYLPNEVPLHTCLIYRENCEPVRRQLSCFMACVDLAAQTVRWKLAWDEPMAGKGRVYNNPRGQPPSFYYGGLVRVRYPQVIDGAVFSRRTIDGKTAWECVDIRTNRDASERFHPDFVALMRDHYFYPDGSGGGWLFPQTHIQTSQEDAVGYRVRSPEEVPQPLGRNWTYPRVVSGMKYVNCRGFGDDPGRVETEFIAYDVAAGAFRPIRSDLLTNRPNIRHMPLEIWGKRMLSLTPHGELLLFELEPTVRLLWRRRISMTLKQEPLLRGKTIVLAASQTAAYAYRLTALQATDSTAPIRESQAYAARAACFRALGQRQKAVRALRKALSADENDAAIVHALATTLLETGDGIAAWHYAENFFARTADADARGLALWKDVVETNGILLRYTSPSIFLSPESIRILPQRKEIAFCETDGIQIFDVRRPDRSRRLKHNLPPCTANRVIAANGGSLLAYQERAGRAKTHILRYDLDHGTVQHHAFPSMDRIDMAGVEGSSGLRAAYDTAPQVFVDRSRPDHLLFFAPDSCRIVGEVQLPEAASVRPHGVPHIRLVGDVAQVGLYPDRYVLAYIPQKRPEWVRVLCISRTPRRILWTAQCGLGRYEKRFLKLHRAFHMQLYPCGSRVLLTLLNINAAYDVETGDAVDGKVDMNRFGAWFDSPFAPLETFQDVSDPLPFPKKAGFWEPVYWLRGDNIGGSLLWDEGPKLLANYRSGKMVLFTRDRMLEAAAPLTRKRGFPFYADGSVAVFAVMEQGDHNPLKPRTPAIYVGRTTNLLRGMGWKDEIPEHLNVDAPLLYERSDMEPRFR